MPLPSTPPRNSEVESVVPAGGVEAQKREQQEEEKGQKEANPQNRKIIEEKKEHTEEDEDEYGLAGNGDGGSKENELTEGESIPSASTSTSPSP